LNEQNQGLDVSRQDVTVAEWIDECMENYVKPRIRPRTYEKYLSSIKNYILPKFGKFKLSELEASSLQKHFNSLLTNGRVDGKGLSPSTVRAARRYFSMCIDDAVREDLYQQWKKNYSENLHFTACDILTRRFYFNKE